MDCPSLHGNPPCVLKDGVMLLPPGPRYEVRKGGIEPSQADTSRTSGGAGAPRPSAVAVAFYHAAMPADRNRSAATVGKRFRWRYNESCADVAQPEEQRFRKPQVKGSSPFIGSTFPRPDRRAMLARLIVRASSGTMCGRCTCFDPRGRLGFKLAHGYIKNHGGNIRWRLSKD